MNGGYFARHFLQVRCCETLLRTTKNPATSSTLLCLVITLIWPVSTNHPSLSHLSFHLFLFFTICPCLFLYFINQASVSFFVFHLQAPLYTDPSLCLPFSFLPNIFLFLVHLNHFVLSLLTNISSSSFISLFIISTSFSLT